jgi:cystinosin
MNYLVVAFLIFLYVCVFTTFMVEVCGHPITDLHWDTFLVAGYAKAAITLVKYMPQVFLNYKRKSTVGWSLANVLLDLTGGTLSLTQEVIDSVALGKSFFGGGGFNIVKFILAIMSIIFDSIFLFQHYVLYADARKNPKVNEFDANHKQSFNAEDDLNGPVNKPVSDGEEALVNPSDHDN